MEKHACKFCPRTFSNGRALGGHMRTHLAALPVKSKPHAPSSSSFSEEEDREERGGLGAEEEEEENKSSLCYGLRENPKKSVRLVDPEFSFAALDAGSVVQDGGSETESSQTAVRPRRRPRSRPSLAGGDKRSRPRMMTEPEAEAEMEPASSVSDTTAEEDVAYSLMLLSRDVWAAPVSGKLRREESGESLEGPKFPRRVRSRFQCRTCKKVFRSFQALGGHRAGHKRSKGCTSTSADGAASESDSEGGDEGQHPIHQCPVCLRVFSSGQALGGHKRSHLCGPAAAAAKAKLGESWIDLNLPAPMEDDGASQIEHSAVSDG